MRAAGERLRAIVADLLSGRQDGATPASLRHDLRTPVTAILGYGELLAEEMRDDDEPALLGPLADILAGAGRLLSEIERLVDFAGPSDPDGTGLEPAVLQRAAEAVRRLTQQSHLAPRRVTGHILVVDDNAAMLDLTTRRLARDGHTVETCPDGGAALARLREETFDLAVLDLMMPGLSGLDVLVALRSDERTERLPVIIISALDDPGTIGRCIEAGADDYLQKPIDSILLRARITSSLDRKFLRDGEQAAAERLRQEQARSDQLLRTILPDRIVERLRAGEDVSGDLYESATILFADLVGFTQLTAAMRPADTIDLLNEIFLGFDELAAAEGLEKIKTIGDAYLVAGGLPDPRPDHATAVAAMALSMPAIVERAARRRAVRLGLRIGVDTGPVVGGIIGRQKFFYDVWGDAVNTASRMEHSCEPGRIHVSAATRASLGRRFACTSRGLVDIRGKGPMETFYLDGRTP